MLVKQLPYRLLHSVRLGVCVKKKCFGWKGDEQEAGREKRGKVVNAVVIELKNHSQARAFGQGERESGEWGERR